MNSKVQSAVLALNKVDSLEALRELTESLSCRAESPDAIVYKGWEKKVSARQLALYIAKKKRLNIIDQTDRAQFLHLTDVDGENLIEQTALRILAQKGASPSEALTGALEFIVGGGKTPSDDSLWGRALSEWYRSLTGNVNTIFFQMPIRVKKSP